MSVPDDNIGDLLRRFYKMYGRPDEGPPPGLDVTQIVGHDSLPAGEREVLVNALGDQVLSRQFSICSEVLEDLATRLTSDQLMRELSSVASHSDQEFDEMLSGVLWFSLASSLDERRGGLPVTPFDEHFDIPLPVKARLTVEGSLVLRLYVVVSGQSKPATKGRMKTSHFEGSIAYCAARAALERNERTQRELAAFDINFGGQRLVQPADCA